MKYLKGGLALHGLDRNNDVVCLIRSRAMVDVEDGRRFPPDSFYYEAWHMIENRDRIPLNFDDDAQIVKHVNKLQLLTRNQVALGNRKVSRGPHGELFWMELVSIE